jgi:hypothetical protein
VVLRPTWGRPKCDVDVEIAADLYEIDPGDKGVQSPFICPTGNTGMRLFLMQGEAPRIVG